MYQRFLRVGIRHPIVSLAMMLSITAGFATQLPKITVLSDWTAWIPEGDDALSNLNELEEIFGSSYLINILVVRDDHPDGIYNPTTLALIDEITEWLRTRPELETGRSADLRSLTTVNDIRGDANGMVVEPFMREPPVDRSGAMAIRDALERNAIYPGIIVGYEGKAAAIVVRESKEARSNHVATYYALRGFLDELEARGVEEQLYITGRPIIEGLFDLYIPSEAERMLPWVLTTLAVFLYLSFRTLRAVLIPLVIIGGTEVWMFGFLAAWGHPMYTITSILPVLIVSIAIADSVHLLAKYYEAQREVPHAGREEILERTVASMGRPILLTSVTTAVGFLSMTSSALAPLQDFGILTSVGIAAAFVLTMVTIPAILSLLPLRPQPIRAAGESRRFGLSLDRMLTRPTIYSDRRPERIVVAFAVLLAISLAGITRLTTDSSQVGQFPPHHHLRVADDIENRYFAGSNVLDILIDGIGVDAMKNPEMLARIDELQRRIEKAPTVRDSFSIVELIKRMNRVMNEDRPDAEVVPSTRDLVAQYLLLYSISGDPGDFDDLIDYDYRYAHVLVFVPTPGTAVSHAVVKRARKIAADLFPPDGPVQASVKFSGRAYSNAALERYINSSQLRSLAICLPVLFLIAWLVFGRAVLGLLCIGPVSLAVLIIYGGMGFISLPTDIATTMIGAMTLGIGIDFAIHYLHRYNSCLAAGMEPSVAAVETSRTAGRALFYNAIILIGGFIVLLGARFYPEIKLGALISATMVICYFSTMLLFPAVLGKLHRSKPTTAHDSDSKPFLPAEGSPKISRVA